jgi:ribosomal protein L14
MIQVGSILKVSDKTGVVLVQCIKVLGNARKRIAFLGDVILVTVQRLIQLDLKMLNYFVEKNFLRAHYIGD